MLVARGAHREAIAARGLTVEWPEGSVTLPVPVVGSPAELTFGPDDVVIVAVKSQDTAGVIDALAAVAPPSTPIVCLQNGVANEVAFLRRFANVHGVTVMAPTWHLEPGVVRAYTHEAAAILDVGRWPGGVDDVDRGGRGGVPIGRVRVARPPRHPALEVHQAAAQPRQPGRRPVPRATRTSATLSKLAHEEGEAVLEAAGIDHVSDAEDKARRGDILRIVPIDDQARPGASTWQSLARGLPVEVDHLNGEIVLLGRLHGVPAPVNAMLQRATHDAVADRTPPARSPPPTSSPASEWPDPRTVRRSCPHTWRQRGKLTDPPSAERSRGRELDALGVVGRDLAEAVGGPVGLGRLDAVLARRHEVPPDEAAADGRAAERHDPRPRGRRHDGVAGIDDGEVARRDGDAVDLDVAVDDQHRPLGVLRRQGEAAAGGEETSAWNSGDAPATGDAAPKPVPTSSRTLTPPSLTAGSSSAPACWNDGAASSASSGRATHVCSPASGDATARASSGERSEWATPAPAVIQFTPPGSMRCTAPVESRCTIDPSNRYVTVASPMCGCGGTSTPTPGASSSGPMRSAKMNGPTIRRAWNGSSRSTSPAPTRRRRGAMIRSTLTPPLCHRPATPPGRRGLPAPRPRG